MNRREVVQGVVAATAAGAGGPLAAAPRPNILFILADDLGWRDLGCYGDPDPATPNLDRLARQGLRLTQAYANSCVCSPTRVSLMTGRYPYRLEVGRGEVLGLSAEGSETLGLPPDHPTLPSLLRAGGYRTSLVGKWHLGFPPHFGPLMSGYDEFYGVYAGAADYFSHRVGGPDSKPGLYDRQTPVDRHGYLTDILADRAISELEGLAAGQRPFLLSLHFTAPHWPWEGPEDEAVSRTLKSLYHADGGSLETYRQMLASLDRNVGRVLRKLDRLRLGRDTIVVFASDNGGERFSYQWPLRGQKTDLLEGGIRVPTLIRWPGRIAAGAVSTQVMATMDWLPTLLSAAGLRADPASAPDGWDLLPVLTGAASTRPRTLYWRYPDRGQQALRHGDWKYLRQDGKTFLFDVAKDPREAADLSAHSPDVVEQLKAMYGAWEREMLPL